MMTRVANSGKLLMDATVAPADIKYPTDLSLLNEAREEAERLVDELWSGASGERKPRTYRKRNGFYPASVHADGIYGTRANRAYLESKGILVGGCFPIVVPLDS